MNEPIWVDRQVVDAVHLDQQREHSGLQGVRHENALESACAQARRQVGLRVGLRPPALRQFRLGCLDPLKAEG